MGSGQCETDLLNSSPHCLFLVLSTRLCGEWWQYGGVKLTVTFGGFLAQQDRKCPLPLVHWWPSDCRWGIPCIWPPLVEHQACLWSLKREHMQRRESLLSSVPRFPLSSSRPQSLEQCSNQDSNGLGGLVSAPHVLCF